MKLKTTLLAILWLLLVIPQHVRASDESPHLSTAASAMLAPPGSPGFTYVANSGCAPVTVQFYSQLNGPFYNWTFGDGGTSTDCNPVHTFLNPGTYTVTLTTSSGGMYSTTITVGAVPVVTFTGDSVSCQNDSKTYTVTSSIAPASYSWVAQGGTVTSSTSTSATVSWNTYGVNYLVYTITTPAGCTKVFRYKVKVIPPPTINLPCCDKRKENGTPQKMINPNGEPGHEGVPGGEAPCNACAGSYNCYTGYIDSQFGLASDYTWTWTVTNGTIVSISNDSSTACVVWGTSGTAKIKLVVTHKLYGCTSTKECEVVLVPGITPVFSVSGNCINSPVTFDASAITPLSDVTSFEWDFGDGTSATTAAPTATHQYSFTGTYTASLEITTKLGCKYKVNRTFQVISGTKPEIVCPGTVCEGTRQCYSTAAIAGATYTWTVTGDIASERIINGNEICVTWASGPAGNVTVVVNNGGYTCTNSATVVVPIVSSVIPVQAPDFICASLNYLQVSTQNYAGACYKWYINGVAIASATSNVLTFNPASYGDPIRIDVEVDFPIGCCHGRGTKIIRKLPQYTLANYTASACVGYVVTYNMIFPAGVPAPPVSWSVVGGVIQSSTPTSVTIKWTTPGAGTITAGNNTPGQYCNDNTNNTWTVNVSAPATGDDISGPAVVCGGRTNTYYHAWQAPTGSTSVSVSPSTGVGIAAGPYSSSITFPSVATVTTYTISVTYNHSTLTNCGTTKTYTVKVLPSTPINFSIPPGNVCQGDVITYTATVPDTINYEWNVIGGTITSQNWNPGTNLLTITVQWNSTLTSSLNITNKICGTTNSQPITVNGKPVVIITPSPVTCGSTSVTLRVAPVWSTYSWSPTPSSTNTVTVTSSGTYSATVSNGVCSNTGTINVPVVTPVAPSITGFNTTPSSSVYCPKIHQICPVITAGSGSISSYVWTFSGFNITTSNVACPNVYLTSMPGPATGTYTLQITDSYGCTATRTGTLTSSCTPNPGGGTGTGCTFVGSFSTTYDPCTGQFTSTTTNVANIYWDFGDGTTGSGLNPVHLYTSACNKTVTCYVTDVNGCVSIYSPINIAVPYAFNAPTIAVTNSACGGASSINVSGISICSTATVTQNYTWTMTPVAGGSPITISTGSANVLNVGSIGAIPNGVYNVTATVTLNGCVRTVTGTFNKGGLQAYFVSCGGCAGSPLTFTDQSTPFNAPLIKWQWNFNGPASLSSSLQNPTVIFPTSGTYTVTLTVTDNNPCTSTYSAVINVLPTFTVGNILVNGTPTAAPATVDVCPGVATTLTAPAGGTSWAWSNGATTPSITVTDEGDYYVTVFNSNNCAKKVGPISIRYKPAPGAIIVTGSDNCTPKYLSAFPGTGYTYAWTYPISSSSPFQSIYLYNSGLVNLTVTNPFGCTASTSQNFTLNPYLSNYVSMAPTPFCPGSTVTISSSPSGGTPPYTYAWNNGNTTASFTTNQAGVYTSTVTDNAGCKASSSISAKPVLPDGVDLLPRGCYTICGQSTTFCAGMNMPWNYTGQWTLNGAPFGPIIPSGGNIAVTFTASGTYILKYAPNDPTYACPAQSAPIVITFTSLPPVNITASNTKLCTGSSVVLTANPQNPALTYTWYLNGVVVGSGFTYVATQGGTYTVVVNKGECCRTEASIDIEEVNCCFDTPDAIFKSITQNTTINTNTFWDGKYYINAVVTVVGSAILDITNVDIVFGPSGTIRFVDNSFLRCNNSVLRPCTKDDIWIGLRFDKNASGWINTTTIKNANIGVHIVGNDQGVRLTDNSFLKCHTAVQIEGSIRQQAISGNTFEIDESQLAYASAPNQYWGIRINNTQMSGLISQNQFRQVDPARQGNLYFGIYMERSNGTLTENKFNDMFRVLDVVGASDVVAFEKNETKLNTQTPDYDKFQIRLTDNDRPVLVYQNIMDNGLGADNYAGAILVANSYRTHIKDNSMSGFRVGIESLKNQELYVASNTINNVIEYGMFMIDNDRTRVSCNTIKGMNHNNGQRIGIYDQETGSNSIYANCIFDMHTSMYFANGNGNRLPELYNNFLYNYDQTGMYIDNYFGAIGNPGGATSAGRNTFMSNNATAGTLDIFSSNSITEDGNFGIQNTVNTSTSTTPDSYYSTASCSHQIEGTYKDNGLDQWNVCDTYYLERWVYKTASGVYQLIGTTAPVSAETVNTTFAKDGSGSIDAVVAEMNKGGEKLTQGAQALLKSTVDRDIVARAIVGAGIAAHELQTASALLSSPELSGMNVDLRRILAIALEIAANNTLTDAQRSELKAIDDMGVRYSALARDLVQVMVSEHDYRFPAPVTVEVNHSNVKNVVSKLNNNLNVYPVPATDFISVKHNVNDANVKGLRIVSAAGAEVTSFKYNVQSGVVNIDISTLADGVYSVVLITDSDNKTVMTGRFIKVK